MKFGGMENEGFGSFEHGLVFCGCCEKEKPNKNFLEMIDSEIKLLKLQVSLAQLVERGLDMAEVVRSKLT